MPFDSSVCFDPNSLLPQVAHNQGLFSDQPVSFSSLWAVTRLVNEKHQKEAYYLNLSVAPSQFHEEPGPRDGGLISLHLSVMLLPVLALTLGLLFCPSIVTACFFSLSLLLCPLLQAEERMQSEVGYKALSLLVNTTAHPVFPLDPLLPPRSVVCLSLPLTANSEAS